jgi:hypothetical protein
LGRQSCYSTQSVAKDIDDRWIAMRKPLRNLSRSAQSKGECECRCVLEEQRPAAETRTLAPQRHDQEGTNTKYNRMSEFLQHV